MERVEELSVHEYAAMRRRGEAHELVDVRTPAELALARLDGGRLLDDELGEELGAMPRETTLVFLCHHGVRSHAAARAFAARGFARVYNLTGGIDRWSREVDPSVPRY
ncbi:MAG: rhodanese [Polyangiaceae bacterium]|nr:rhodanese [Polyangiaceae bacterium]